MLKNRALLFASVLGTVLQVAMVVVGHSNKSIAGLFAVGGMGISLIASLAYAMWARGDSAFSLAVGGLAAGALCALIGIFVSYMLGDVPMSLLALGTISSAVTGALGGWLGKFLFRVGVAVALLVVVANAPSEAAAQTTTPLANASSTVATTSDFTWLVGHWEGHMVGGVGVADVIFSPPAGGLIIGVMRLLDGDKVLVVELISLVDTPTGVEVRFRHFSSTLEAYEPTYKQNMRLTTHDGDRDVFENAVAYDKALMSTQPRMATWKRIDADSFVGHSDIIGDDGKPGMVEVTYHRLK